MPEGIEEPVRFKLAKNFAIILLAGFVFWLYYPALSLPLSLVDDYVKLNNLDRLLEHYQSGGLSKVVENDISIVNRTYNLGFYLLTALEFRISGGQPFHWLILLKLGFVCCVLYLVINKSVPCKKVAVFSGLLSGFIFAASNVPGGIDLHGLRMNWYRLFATDADGLVTLAAHLFCLITAVREHRLPYAWLWALAAGVAGFLATTIKIPYVAIILTSLLATTAISLVIKDKTAAWRLIFITGFISLTFGVYYLSMRAIAASAPKTPGAYGSNVMFTMPELWAGAMYYVENFGDLYGPLLLALVTFMVILLPYVWQERRSMPVSLYLLAYLTVFTVMGILIYTAWGNRLWRYMLVSHFGFCGLIGIVTYFAVKLFGKTKSKLAYTLIFAMGMGATLLNPKLLAIALLLVTVTFLVKRSAAVTAFPAGVALVGMAYITYTVPMDRNAINNNYIGHEHANWQAVMQALKYSAEKRTIFFAGDLANEQIGSLEGHISRMGIEPRLQSFSDLQNNTSSPIVLLNRDLSPEEVQAQFSDETAVVNLAIPQNQFRVPVSFWSFRRRLFGQEEYEGLTYNVWSRNYVWRYYALER